MYNTEDKRQAMTNQSASSDDFNFIVNPLLFNTTPSKLSPVQGEYFV